MTGRAGVIVACAATLLLVGGCSGGEDAPAAGSAAADAVVEDAGDGSAPGQPDDDDSDDGDSGEPDGVRLTDDDHVVVAESATTVDLHQAPQRSSPLAPLPADALSGRNVFVVDQQLGEWLQVRLPHEVEGHDRAWIHSSEVSLSRHRYHIVVSLGDHVLTVRSGEVEAMRVPVAVGPDAPPPGSERFLKDLVATPDPGGRYGSLAYGLSGATNELAEFRQGRGVVAIHGTDTPDALGRDVPAGAIAVADAEITRMVESLGLPLGTPVAIRP